MQQNRSFSWSILKSLLKKWCDRASSNAPSIRLLEALFPFNNRPFGNEPVDYAHQGLVDTPP